jgi:GR25 family glycosyltransferase involved in LPS biosynthesis
MGMENFVINLAREPQKYEGFLKRNAGSKIDFQRYEACDGGTLSEAEAVKMMIVTTGTKFTAGSIGCAISHNRLWQRCIESGKPIIVFEDDVAIRDDFSEQMPKLLSALDRWDYVTFGYNTDSILDIEVLNGISSALAFTPNYPTDGALRDFVRSSKPSSPYRLKNCFGTCGYMISPAGAKRLSKLCFPMNNRTITIPAIKRSFPAFNFDCILNDVYPKVEAYAAFPPLVLPKNDRKVSTTRTEGV